MFMQMLVSMCGTAGVLGTYGKSCILQWVLGFNLRFSLQSKHLEPLRQLPASTHNCFLSKQMEK